MGTPTTVGRVLLENAVPEEFHKDIPATLDKSRLRDFFDVIAAKAPDKFKDILHKFHQIGAKAAFESGGYSPGLDDLITPPELQKVRDDIRQRVRVTLKQTRGQPADVRSAAVNKVLATAAPELADAVKKFVPASNAFMQQVKSTAKGNISNVQALLAGEVQYADQNYKPIPFPVLSSFSEGVEPHEYFAGCFGSRQGLVTLKLGTAVGGYFAKRLRNAANRLVVSARDGTTPEVPRGLPVDTTDPHNEGAALAVPIAGYPRNTILTPAIQHALATKGVNRILVRSPLVGGPSDGGVYAYDVGVRDSGALPVLGDAVGQVAIESATEPAVQSLISAKHTGGVVGASTAQEGFPVLDRLVSAPQVFPGAATHARVAGSIDKIEPAPQGGTFMTIAGETHYIAPELKVTRKLGEKVDEGDMLSSGTPNPDDFVRAKGIGEGRRLFTDAFMKANHAAAFKVNRRNVELLARALIDHVELHEEHGPFNPGDIVSYSVLEHEYTPRADAKELETSTAVGQYLEKPVLHLTIGTKITKPLANELASFGVKSLQVHPKPPSFTPVFVRSHDTVNYDPDWMTRSLGTHLVGGLLEGVHRGDTSDATSTSYVPRVASGLVHQPKYLTFPSK